jgi:hypothetical protein
MLVLADADVDKAVSGALVGMRFTRQGQSCTAAPRILIHRSLHNDFVAKLQATRLFHLAEECEPTMTSLDTTYLIIVGMLALATFPVLVPVIVTAGHAIRRRSSEMSAGRVQGREVLDATY